MADSRLVSTSVIYMMLMHRQSSYDFGYVQLYVRTLFVNEHIISISSLSSSKIHPKIKNVLSVKRVHERKFDWFILRNDVLHVTCTILTWMLRRVGSLRNRKESNQNHCSIISIIIFDQINDRLYGIFFDIIIISCHKQSSSTVLYVVVQEQYR